MLAKTKLRAVARMGVGYDSVDIAAATDLGIAVTITPGTLEESVAEHTVAIMLGVSAGAGAARPRGARRPLEPRGDAADGRQTFGIVGLGRIGRAVVPKMQGLGMRVSGSIRSPTARPPAARA